jgi:ankyrin repeat protein
MSRSTVGGLLLTLLSVAHIGAVSSDARLVEAIKARNTASVRALIREHVDPNSPEADGTTPLHWAARVDDVELVKMLLRAGARADSPNRYGSTPLELAAVNGNAEIIDLLLKAGADPNSALPEGETALMTAARTGNPDALRVLIANGANVNAREGWLGQTALMWAAEEDHAAAVRVLIENGADPNAKSTALKFPRKVRGQTTLPVGGVTPLMFAARQGAVQAATMLADHGVRLNETDPDGTTALVFAIINGHYDLAAVLLEKGADPNVADSTGMAALYAAVDMHTLPFMHGRPAPKVTGKLDAVGMVTVLLAHGANVDAALKTPILRRHNNASNQTLGAGTTPLMRAAKSGDVALMRMLLDYGADPNLRQKDGTTLLMLAAGFGRRFDQNADSQEFELATEADLYAGVRFCVLEIGVDVNAVNDVGDTALHWAGADSIRFLAASGARLDAKNKQGKTPLDAAMARKDRSERQLRPDSIVALQGLGAPLSAGQHSVDITPEVLMVEDSK